MVEEKDVSYVPLEDLLKKVDSIYRLVLMASRRAVEISDTGQKLVDISPRLKATTVALEEVRQGKISYRVPESDK
ncbi:MAG: DNA-directed RNA polymerase subunit omega [Candidatus Omnitrophica bacterium]|nr:DNA-directed RNA polymerase subunit omega [Candidatus Omnitrophota bacterium]